MVRKSYTVAFKKSVLKEAEETSILIVSQKYKISERLIYKWKADMKLSENNEESSEDDNARKKFGGGRKPVLEEHESQIFDWVVDRRTDGLVVKRADTKKFAVSLYESSFIEEEILTGNKQFKASEKFSARQKFSTPHFGRFFN